MDEHPPEQHPDGTECHMPAMNQGGQTEEKTAQSRREKCKTCIRRWFPRKPYERWSLVLSAVTLVSKIA